MGVLCPAGKHDIQESAGNGLGSAVISLLVGLHDVQRILRLACWFWRRRRCSIERSGIVKTRPLDHGQVEDRLLVQGYWICCEICEADLIASCQFYLRLVKAACIYHDDECFHCRHGKMWRDSGQTVWGNGVRCKDRGLCRKKRHRW